MDHEIKTYIVNTKQFEDESVYKKSFDFVSAFRQQKITHLKNVEEKKRSLAAAIALNAALKEYDLEERMMKYALGNQGKPYFRDHPEIHFSLSHSGDYAVCSIGAHEVGNDIERVRSGREKVAQRFFAKEELDWIYDSELSDESNDRDSKIFRIWTMKESFLKVTGRGMSLPLNDFAILISENEYIKIRQNINDKTYYIKEYIMPYDFNESDNYKISVCSEAMDFSETLRPII